MDKVNLSNYILTLKTYASPVAVLLILIALGLFIYFPYYNDIQKQNENIVTYQSKLDKLKSEGSILNKYSFQKAIDTLSSNLIAVENVIPSSSEISYTGSILESMATSSGFALSTLDAKRSNNDNSTPSNVTVTKDQTTGLEKIEYKFNFIGDRSALDKFLAAIKNSRRLFTINSMSVKGQVDGPSTAGGKYIITIDTYDLDSSIINPSVNSPENLSIPSNIDNNTLNSIIQTQNGNQ